MHDFLDEYVYKKRLHPDEKNVKIYFYKIDEQFIPEIYAFNNNTLMKETISSEYYINEIRLYTDKKEIEEYFNKFEHMKNNAKRLIYSPVKDDYELI